MTTRQPTGRSFSRRQDWWLMLEWFRSRNSITRLSSLLFRPHRISSSDPLMKKTALFMPSSNISMSFTALPWLETWSPWTVGFVLRMTRRTARRGCNVSSAGSLKRNPTLNVILCTKIEMAKDQQEEKSRAEALKPQGFQLDDGDASGIVQIKHTKNIKKIQKCQLCFCLLVMIPVVEGPLKRKR